MRSLWFLSLEFVNMVAHTQFTFLKYPCLGPPSTPSGKKSKKYKVIEVTISMLKQRYLLG
jgi:hypothetical protein